MGDNALLIVNDMHGIDDEISLSGDDDRDEISSPLLNNDGVEEEFVSVDEFTNYAGEYGRYQIFIQTLVMVTIIPLTYPVMIFYYIGHGPEWKCTSPITTASSTLYGLANHSTVPTWCSNNTRTYEHSDTERCHMNRTMWKYEHRHNKTTIVTEFDLVCNNAWLDALSGSVVFVGWGLGIIGMGYLSDQYGRKRVMYPCYQLTLICLLLHGFVNNIWLLIALRFFMGLFFSAPALNNYILVMELVGARYRVIATSLAGFSWPLGALLLTLKAYYVTSWRTLCILCSAPYLLCIFTAICVPESVRWLNMKGRKKEAEAILKRAAEVNKKVLPPLLSLRHFDTTTDTMKASYLDLFKRWSLLKLVLAQAFIWFHTGMSYYAMNWEFADIGGDMYVNFILSFLVEIPGNIVCILTLDRFGRRRMTFIFNVVTSLCCIGVVLIPKNEEYKTFRLVVGLLGKCTIGNVFSSIYIWSSEIYSTVARTQGMALNIVTSRLGAAVSPFIKILDQFHPAGSFLLMTATSVIATFLCVALPETLNQPTRETLDDMLSTRKQQHTVEMPVVFNMNTNVGNLNENMTTVVAVPYEQMANEDEDEDNDLLLGNRQVRI